MIVAGLGFRRDCPAAELVAVLRDAEQRAAVAVDELAVPHFKHAEPGLVAALAQLGLPLHEISDAALRAAQPGCVTHSDIALHHTGHASIAEAAALAAAGPGARLLLPRIAHARATCALAHHP